MKPPNGKPCERRQDCQILERKLLIYKNILKSINSGQQHKDSENVEFKYFIYLYIYIFTGKIKGKGTNVNLNILNNMKIERIWQSLAMKGDDCDVDE